MRCVKILCSCMVTVCLLVISLGKLTDVMERKNSDFKNQPFFAQEEDFDVLFLGTSHVINGIFPMELWKDYGIISYNFGGHGNSLPTSYWVMENALDYTNPKLVVLDGLGLASNMKINSVSQVHVSMDAFPLTKKKAIGIHDLMDDPILEEKVAAGEMEDTAERTDMSFLWDFSVYHSRWEEIGASDFEAGSSKEKGAESRIAVREPIQIPVVPDSMKLEGETVGIEYVEKTVQECRKRGIEVLLVYLPFPAVKEFQMDANRLADIARELGVNYINFLDLGLVDYRTDCYDSSSHLNPSGARKVTDYLGKYIQEHYGIEDQRENAAYSGWKEDYTVYEAFKENNLKQQQALDTYLMLLADKNYDALIEIKDPVIWKSKYYTALLENLGIDSEKVSRRTDCIFVQGAGRDVGYFDGFHLEEPYQAGQQCDTPIGTFQAKTGEDGDFVVLLDRMSCYSVHAQQDENTDVRIAVFKSGVEQPVDVAGFSLQSKADIPDGQVSVTGVYRE